jgi:hypothetical protein
LKILIAVDGESYHIQPVLIACFRKRLLERRTLCRNKNEFLGAKVFHRCGSNGSVTKMNGIERAPKQRNASLCHKTTNNQIVRYLKEH